MSVDLTTVLVALISVASGGVSVELLRYRLTKREKDQKAVQQGMEFFYKTWRAEATRMQREIRDLRAMVVALSVELQKLGGDPMSIRLALEAAHAVADHHPDPETEIEDEAL